jgi:hypothetical protein
MMQNVLIQVQQQKVEMQRTMAMLDKLMRSNEVRGPVVLFRQRNQFKTS